MNLFDYYKSIDPEGWDKQVERAKKRDKERFYIGGQSGFKWSKRSNNKTWIEDGNIIKEKKGKKLPPQ
tara:strand:+ start:416 stop:619 length:204 start_codon:yes stop_codon:yes gene_type:complete